jgi:hypothetical protein
MDAEGLPVKRETLAAFATATADMEAQARARRIVASALPADGALQIGDPVEFVAALWSESVTKFDSAFRRWRELFRSASEDRDEAHRIGQRTGLGAQERREARTRYVSADKQVELLASGVSSQSSDFYVYRYLATEGFLPGYNFPRLPLYAFVDADKSSTVLQRPRFLALAEFGPNSLVYHEGKAYRCNRAKLPSGSRNEKNTLVTRTLKCCHSCGAAHESETQERCVVCNAALTDEGRLSKLYRIENVDAVPGARITANDEDRQRRGFDLRTIFEWEPRRQEELLLKAGDSPLAVLCYGPQTKLSRVNLGLRRRKEKTHTGFDIDTLTGLWLKDPEADDDQGEDPKAARRQSIVPVVEDTKNALLVRFDQGLGLTIGQMATLQHALIRAIEAEHVLETGELLGEPLPTRENRKAILLYEATEGGAGVLKRLMDGPERWRRIAEVALDLLHLERGTDGYLHDTEDACVAGCYRCLLSYYNQPDHEMIDREDGKVRDVIERMGRCERDRPAGDAITNDDPWLAALVVWNAPAPRSEIIAGATWPLCWPDLLVMAVAGTPPPELVARCAVIGRDLIELPELPGETMPPTLAAALGVPA